VVEDQPTIGNLLITETDITTSGELRPEESQAKTDTGTPDTIDSELPSDVTTAKELVYSMLITDKLLQQFQDT
jgi:hypothetical protein